MDAINPNTVKAWKIVVAAIVIFTCGVITGGLLGYTIAGQASYRIRNQARMLRLLPSPMDFARAQPPQPDQQLLEQRRIEFLRAAQRQLKLTEEQKARIGKIIREAQEKSRAIMRDVLPELRREWDCAYQSILSELTPEQRTKFMRLVRRWFAENIGKGNWSDQPRGQSRVSSQFGTGEAQADTNSRGCQSDRY